MVDAVVSRRRTDRRADDRRTRGTRLLQGSGRAVGVLRIEQPGTEHDLETVGYVDRVEHLPEPGTAQAEWNPTVAEFHRATQGPWGSPAHPDREALLHRARFDDQPAEPIVGAFVVRFRYRQRRSKSTQRIFGAIATAVELDA